tara:strand:+ start:358 stop:1107 length:750 start_codon:yes stop_codon:yes gene_type:complete
MQNFKKNKITIITVVKNSVNKIERCIQSVINQNYDHIEYIVIDGGSNDGTIDIIKKYEYKIDKVIIENDKGIWDAMNKGLKIAKGDIVGFLNSDDTYNHNTLKIVNNYFNNFKIDFLFGSVKKYKTMHGFSPWKIKYSFGFYTSHSVGFFIDLNQHKKIGFYNLKYLSADLDLFYKMIVKYKMKGISSKKKEIFGEFSKGGFSSKIDYMDHLVDLNQIRIDNGQNKFFVYILFLIKILKKPFKFLKSIT